MWFSLDDRVRTQKHFIPSIYKKLMFTAKANRRSTHRHSGASPPAVSGFAVLTLRQPGPRQHRACPADRPTVGTAGGREEGWREDCVIAQKPLAPTPRLRIYCRCRAEEEQDGKLRGSHLLRGAVEALRRLQDVLPALQLGGLSVTDVTQLLLQRLQLSHILLLPDIEQGGNLLVQLHVHSKPFLPTQTGSLSEKRWWKQSFWTQLNELVAKSAQSHSVHFDLFMFNKVVIIFFCDF